MSAAKPQVLLVDSVILDAALAILQEIASRLPHLPVFVLTNGDPASELLLYAYFQETISLLTQAAFPSELAKALEAELAGGYYVSPALTHCSSP